MKLVQPVSGRMPFSQGTGAPKREPLAIVGFSLKFPQDAVSEEAFWDMLLKGRTAHTEIPKDRLNIDGFVGPKQNEYDTLGVRAGCFLTDDIAAFDAAFFSMSTAEATAADPLQRGLLETTYRALESAGMKIENVAGSNTSVFVGSLSDDYKSLNSKDPERLTQYATTGVFDCMLANRLSWFYNFTGNSVTLDTACSSSLIALDLACQGLLAGESDMTVVAGCNLMFSPDLWLLLDGINVLSPDGVSQSFDSRANGYGRGEGFAVVIVKRLSDALRDNDTIRAVIRSTGSNQNGHTPSGITQTSQAAQESLMRETYAKAGIDMSLTQYVEAHATGTKFGDAVELKSIGRTFRSSRSSPNHPLHVGCVKPNIGHLEGASGLAGVIKTVLILENGVIPPVAGFEKINIRANESYLRIKIPREPTRWPTQGLRRASVNSFGLGGSNAHVVLDDAYHFLEAHGLTGNTTTKVVPGMQDLIDSPHSTTEDRRTSKDPFVLVWSSGDESGISRLAQQFAHYAKSLEHQQEAISSLAYTLHHRRSLLRHRSFAIATSIADLQNLETQISTPVNTSSDSPRVGFVFTGQGAIWPKVAQELCVYPGFLRSLKEAELYLQKLNCPWKLTDELFKESEDSNVYRSEYSQPLSTVIQIALVDLLYSFGVKPAVVVGHSSGEIAAAYCSGAISKQSAWKLSYYRGLLSAKMQATSRTRGAMLAVLLSEAKTLSYLETVEKTHGRNGLQIACYNSEENLTISGDEDHIDTLQSILTEAGHRWHRLKVDVAYHSTHMTAISEEFLSLISDIEGPNNISDKSSILMVSTLTGTLTTTDELLDPQYWVRNLVSPVKFHQAISQLCKPPVAKNRVLNLDLSHRKDCSVDCLVEVGPHSALQGPIRSVLRNCSNTTSQYMAVLQRGQNGLLTVLEAAGKLFCAGYPIDLAEVNRLPEEKEIQLISDLPQYPFNHTQKYWYESRLSNSTRFPAQGKHELLGKPVADWNPLDARWRRFLSTADVPWLEDHKVQNQVLMPGAGMLTMVIEATKQLAMEDRQVIGFELTNIKFLAALVVPFTETVESQLSIRPRQQNDIYSRDESWFEFRLFSVMKGHWTEHCRGNIAVQYENDQAPESGTTEDSIRSLRNGNKLDRTLWGEPEDTRQFYRFLNHHGFDYGPAFQVLENTKVAEEKAIADIKVYKETQTCGNYNSYTIHPITLDGIMQVVLASLTKGGSESIPTMVPTRIDRLRVSISVQYSSPGNNQGCISAAAQVTTSSFPWSKATVTVLDAQDQILVNVDGLRFTAVSDDSSDGGNTQPRTTLCRRIDWQPDVTLLANDEIGAICRRGSPPESSQVQECHDIDRLIYLSWNETLRDWDESNSNPNVSTTIRKYVLWAKHQLKLYYPDDIQKAHLDDSSLLISCRKEVEEASHRGKLYGLVSKRLPVLLSGELDPLSLLFQDDLISQFYQEMNNELSFHALSQYLSLLTHQNPSINMIEIGAGTGATTRIILDQLCPHGNQDSNAHFKCYDFTDISPSFFEKAQAEFGHLREMSFKVLDIEQPPEEQGFELGSYDVVIAANVLHATKSLNETLRHVRSLLKDGGKLVLIELVRPELARTGFVFGLLQGWWLGVNDDRVWGPLITENEWNERLLQSGFSGTDLIFRDSEQPDCHEMSVLISTAAHSTPKELCGPQVPPLVVVLPDESRLSHFCHSDFKNQMEQAGVEIHDIVPLKEVSEKEIPTSAVFIFMLELGDSFISSISSKSFCTLKKIFSNANGVVWITRSGHEVHPSYQMIEGLARTIRRENNKTTFLTIAFDTESGNLSRSQVEKLCQILKRTDFQQQEISYDGDYFERDGKMHIGRVKVNKQLSDAVASHTLVHTTAPETTGKPGSSLALEVQIKTPGALDSLHFTNDAIYGNPIKDNEVEIQVEASGLIFRDCLMASGKIPLTSFGLECAGLVTRAGAQSGFTPGQRVYGMADGTIKSFARLDRHCANEIPGKLSFAEAASIPISFITAYHSLSKMARISPEDSVLIHSGAGGTGQAAIQVAKYLGVTKIFTTVSTEAKKEYLIKHYGIPADHIFSSRDTSFADEIASMTKDGVDVVLNSLSGQGLLASWNCMAPYGRFIELGKRDIMDNNSLPMQPFLRNVSYIAVDIQAIVKERPRLLAHSLAEISKLLTEKKLHPIQPLKKFEFSKFGEAVQHMLSGQSVGKVVLVKEPSLSLPVMLMPENSLFSSKKTYVIAGGLGGVGRSIARWMVEHGARYLVLFSRSGPSNLASKRFVQGLQAQGVTVNTPACDISDAESLQSVLETVKNSLPPVAGCIQAAMVLRDSLFEKMSHEDWKAAVKPKVDGSWNLHALLPRNLDFFILLSSLGGVVGFSGQSNYAAGNTYQDALARYRRACGLRAVSVDLGGMFSDGYISENEEVAQRIFAPGYYTPLYRNDLFALLGNLCRPDTQHDAQVLFGLTRPAHLSSGDFKTYSNGVLAPPLFSAMWNDHGASGPNSSVTPSAQVTLDIQAEFIQAQGEVEAGEIVAQATIRKLQGILPNMEKAEIWKPMLTYGVDSLVAVELRNWYSKEFRAQVTAFDIMGGESFMGLGTRIAMLSELRKNKDTS